MPSITIEYKNNNAVAAANPSLLEESETTPRKDKAKAKTKDQRKEEKKREKEKLREEKQREKEEGKLDESFERKRKKRGSISLPRLRHSHCEKDTAELLAEATGTSSSASPPQHSHHQHETLTTPKEKDKKKTSILSPRKSRSKIEKEKGAEALAKTKVFGTPLRELLQRENNPIVPSVIKKCVQTILSKGNLFYLYLLQTTTFSFKTNSPFFFSFLFFIYFKKQI
jgi:hypothetical protein